MRETLVSNSIIRIPKFTDNQCDNKKPNHPHISDLLASSDKCFSIEICANRDLDVNLLAKLNPSFCSITWHSPSSSDFNEVGQIPAVSLARRLCCQGYNVLLHLAGRNLRRHQALGILQLLKDIGVRNIFALQGDPSQIKEKDDAKCDFPYAVDLVRFIRVNFGNHFCIGVAGYPEKHPASRSFQEDITHLKEKVDSGADFIITQASYDFEAFKQFSKRCKTSDINIPIIPGIFVISSYKSLMAMSKFCGVPISSYVLTVVDSNKNNNAAVREFGIHHATLLVKYILCSSHDAFKGFHIFSLNDLQLVQQVLKRLGLFELYIEYPF